MALPKQLILTALAALTLKTAFGMETHLVSVQGAFGDSFFTFFTERAQSTQSVAKYLLISKNKRFYTRSIRFNM